MMIKFFRRIREKLVLENPSGPSTQKGSMRKYLLYAIGEIALVMVGILLALQVNNWNEDRKEAVLELKMLQGLREDLNYSARQLNIVRSSDSIIVSQNKTLLTILRDPGSAYHDSLQSYFGSISRYNVFSPRRMTYETLKSRGVEIIKNDTLRSEITMLYDEDYQLNSTMKELKREIHMNSVALHNKRLFTLEKVGLQEPVDFAALKSDDEFINNLSYVTAESVNFIDHYQNMYNRTKALEEKIVNEIKGLGGND